MSSNEDRYSLEEVLLGLFFIAACGALIFASLKYARIERFWKKRQEITVVFSAVGSLTADSPVRYNGLEVGRVKALEPIHLDEKLIAKHFRQFSHGDIYNLPIRADSLRRKILEFPAAEFDKEVKRQLVNTTMIKLVLEVLAENDPIRYHLDDEVRIVTTVFGDSVVEIISGSGELNKDGRNQYVLGNAGDFFDNVLKSMAEMKKIIGEVRIVFGAEERKNISKFQSRIDPIDKNITLMTNLSKERTAKTLARFNKLTKDAKATLNRAGDVLESLQPSAQTATESIQNAFKEIKDKAKLTEAEVSEAIKETTAEFTATSDAIKVPITQLREGLDGVKADLFEARTTVEKAPARIDAAIDPAGSVTAQSEADMERFAKSVKKIVYNLKIAAYVAKENKDLMLGNRDVGEYAAQSVIDIQRRLGRISRRMRDAGAEAVEAARDMESDMMAGPVIERAEAAAKTLSQIRAPIDELRDRADDIFMQPWRERKRAYWYGDGLYRSE